jgi:uncharacterized protein (DUF2235 family)
MFSSAAAVLIRRYGQAITSVTQESSRQIMLTKWLSRKGRDVIAASRPGNSGKFHPDAVLRQRRGADGTPLEKLTGGAFGLGIFQKIKDGYTKISQVYDADDEIFIFGFSRGAYTARQPCRHDCDLWPPYRKFR